MSEPVTHIIGELSTLCSRVNLVLARFHYLHGWVVPGDIVEAEIISEYEKDVRLSVELGSSLLLL